MANKGSRPARIHQASAQPTPAAPTAQPPPAFAPLTPLQRSWIEEALYLARGVITTFATPGKSTDPELRRIGTSELIRLLEDMTGLEATSWDHSSLEPRLLAIQLTRAEADIARGLHVTYRGYLAWAVQQGHLTFDQIRECILTGSLPELGRPPAAERRAG